MRIETALAYYDQSRRKLATAADVSTQTVHRWVKLGYVPIKSANKLAKKTEGGLPVDPSVYQ